MNIKEEEHDYQRPDGLEVPVKRVAKKPVKKNYNNWL